MKLVKILHALGLAAGVLAASAAAPISASS